MTQQNKVPSDLYDYVSDEAFYLVVNVPDRKLPRRLWLRPLLRPITPDQLTRHRKVLWCHSDPDTLRPVWFFLAKSEDARAKNKH